MFEHVKRIIAEAMKEFDLSYAALTILSIAVRERDLISSWEVLNQVVGEPCSADFSDTFPPVTTDEANEALEILLVRKYLEPNKTLEATQSYLPKSLGHPGSRSFKLTRVGRRVARIIMKRKIAGLELDHGRR